MSGIARKLAASVAFALTLAAVSGAAHAQDGKPQRVRGQIVAVEGDHLSLKGPDGKNFDLVLDGDATIQGVEAATLADIKPGSFVGSAADPDGDGLKALEVHIFPAGSRQGEGHRPWDPKPGSSMTNADVTAAAVKSGDGQLTLRTGNQDYKLSVPPGTPIVKYVPGSRALLVPGNYVGAQAAVESKGVLTAKAITAGAVPWPIR